MQLGPMTRTPVCSASRLTSSSNSLPSWVPNSEKPEVNEQMAFTPLRRSLDQLGTNGPGCTR